MYIYMCVIKSLLYLYIDRVYISLALQIMYDNVE